MENGKQNSFAETSRDPAVKYTGWCRKRGGSKLIFSILAFLLVAALAVVIYLTVTVSDLESEVKNLKRKKSVKVKTLILGAGVAGISAAKTLYDSGQTNFLVLEAQDYMGGRNKPRRFGDVSIEEGANWIHGYELSVENNPLVGYKKEYNLKGVLSNTSDIVVRDEQGVDITNRTTINRFLAAWKQMDQLAKIYDGDDKSIKEIAKTFGWEANTMMEMAIERLYMEFWYGKNIQEASFYNWGVYEQDFFITDPRGYGVFIGGMQFPFTNKILLNREVSHINRENSSVVKVELSNGDVYEADYVLSTFSNGVLQSGSVKYTPPYPEKRFKSLAKIGMELYTKIYLKFPTKFWDDKEYIMFATNRTDGYYHTWQDLSRAGMYGTTNPGYLQLTCTGETSERVEASTDQQVLDEVMGIMRGVYGNSTATATDIFVSRWSQNKFTRGAYPDTVIGCEDEDFTNIASNLGRIFYAGDGTDWDDIGCGHGAMKTGVQKAKQILDCIKGLPQCKVNNV